MSVEMSDFVCIINFCFCFIWAPKSVCKSIIFVYWNESHIFKVWKSESDWSFELFCKKFLLPEDNGKNLFSLM